MAGEYVTLLGAESVQNAGHAMERAAQGMRSAAGEIEQALRQHQQFLTDWLANLETLLAEKIQR